MFSYSDQFISSTAETPILRHSAQTRFFPHYFRFGMEAFASEAILLAHKDERVGISTAYKMVKLLKATETEVDFYNAKVREAYAELAVGEGIPEEKKEEVGKRVEELRNAEVDKPVTRFELGEFVGLRLSMSEVYVIDDFIEEEADDNKDR